MMSRQSILRKVAGQIAKIKNVSYEKGMYVAELLENDEMLKTGHIKPAENAIRDELFDGLQNKRLNKKKLTKKHITKRIYDVYINDAIKYAVELGKVGNVEISLKMGVMFRISDDYEVREINTVYRGKPSSNNIFRYIRDVIVVKFQFAFKTGDLIQVEEEPEKEEDYMHGAWWIKYARDTSEIKVKIDYTEIGKMRLYESENIANISALFDNEKFKLNECVKGCVKNALYEHYKLAKAPKEILKEIKEMTKDYYTSEDIQKFCEKNKLEYTLYDIRGNIVRKSTEETININKFYGMVYCGHLYVLTDEYKNCKIQLIEDGTIYIKDIDEKFEKMANDNKQIFDLRCIEKKIKSFFCEGIRYHNNEEYQICCEIWKAMGIEKKMDNLMTLSKLGNAIEDYFLNDSEFKIIYNDGEYEIIKKREKGKVAMKMCQTQSFFPFYDEKRAYKYVSDDYDETENYESDDMKKCYATMLMELDFLIVADYTTCDIRNDIYNDDIQDDYLYIAKPEKENIILQNRNIYTGRPLNIASEHGLNFVVEQEMTTKRVPNVYRPLIRLIRDKLVGIQYMVKGKLCEVSKEIINRWIGNFAHRQYTINTYTQLEEYIPDKQANHELNICCCKIGSTDFTFKQKTVTRGTNLRNRSPIHAQILDEAQIKIFMRIKQLKLKNNDVMAIITDGIIYRTENEYISNKLWIQKPYSKKTLTHTYECPEDSTVDFTQTNIQLIDNKKNVIVSANAGCGKTYAIKKILERMIKWGKKYIVISPSQSSLCEYREDYYNCQVVQYYVNQCKNIENDMDYVIVDEMGMVDSQGWLKVFISACMGSKVICMGDMNQLPSIDGQIINKHFLKIMFDKATQCKTNYRNNFERIEYKRMMDCKLTYDEKEEYINKYCNSKKPEYIIGYRVKTCADENLRVLEEMRKYNKTEETFNNLAGARIILKSNDYAKKYNVYNNFELTISEHNRDIIITEEGIKLKLSQLGKKFLFAYCVNLHFMQGRECKKIKMLEADKSFFFNDPRKFYVLVSRFSEKLNDKQIRHNENNKLIIKLDELDTFDKIFGDESEADEED